MKIHVYREATIGVALLLASASVVFAQQPSVQERVVALKASIAASQAILKQYEWIETTVIAVDGKEKSRKQERCYYGAEGGVQKVQLSQTTAPQKKRRLFGKVIAAQKQEELADYMKEAVELVKMYMPPDQFRIESAKAANRVSITPGWGERTRLTFASYIKPGDSLALDVDLTSNRPLAATVSTYLDSQKEAVSLNVQFGTLNNNATYPASVVLNAPGKKLKVTVQNSGYTRK